jgi:hypothetical protein
MSLSNCSCVRAVLYNLFTVSASFWSVGISAARESDWLHELTIY